MGCGLSLSDITPIKFTVISIRKRYIVIIDLHKMTVTRSYSQKRPINFRLDFRAWTRKVGLNKKDAKIVWDNLVEQANQQGWEIEGF